MFDRYLSVMGKRFCTSLYGYKRHVSVNAVDHVIATYRTDELTVSSESRFYGKSYPYIIRAIPFSKIPS